MALNARELRIRFAPPKDDDERAQMKAQISTAAGVLASLLHELVPGSREESIAVEALEGCVMWAHAGIDRRYTPRAERRGSKLPLEPLPQTVPRPRPTPASLAARAARRHP